MEDNEHIFMSHCLSVLVRRARFLVAALDLEHRFKREEREPDNLRCLDLAINPGEEVNPEAVEECYDRLCMDFFIYHEEDFHHHYLEESNDLKKYLYKYLSLLLKIFSKVPSLSPYYDFIHILHLMYNEDIKDGVLLKRFLLQEEGKWQIKRAVKEMDPDVLEFLLHNIKVSCHEGGIGSYELIQEMLPLNICEVSGDLMTINILLKFGHESFFTEEYYAPSISVGWRKLFGEKFWNVQSKIGGIFSLKRIYFIMLMYGAFVEKDSDPRAAYLAVVKKLWRALPDPRITCQEINDTLGKLVPAESKKRVETFCLDYEQEFGNSSYLKIQKKRNTPTPRSLKHASRCVIRRAISRNARFPEGVVNLHIPLELKDYLKLEL